MNKFIITAFILGSISFLNAQSSYISVDKNGELKRDRSYLQNIYEKEYLKVLQAPGIKQFAQNFKAKLKNSGQTEDEANTILNLMIQQELLYNLLEEKYR